MACQPAGCNQNRYIIPMHYYQFNIGDYTKKTKHLTPLEDIAYRRMLDLFYDTEDPLPCEISRIARLIVMPENQEEIRQVLNEFWTETDAGWVDNRAEREIESYHRKAESARVNGKKGGRPKTQKKPKKTEPVNLANPAETESKANHKPITNNQEPVNNKDIPQSEDCFDRFWDLYGKKKGRKDCLKKWKSLKDDQIAKIFEVVSAYVASTPDVIYRKDPKTWLNQECWNDEIIGRPGKNYANPTQTANYRGEW